MTMSNDTDSQLPPLQFKGEIMDFDLGLEVDHRKRRRNRTTQSCLNCHTSKRKEEALSALHPARTGLCVYEVDDPALRDDPNIDENTRLRNRIAELESLVRELRGKPHPRWADPNFCDGDTTEKWHSRSSRRTQPQYQKLRRDGSEDGHLLSHVPPVVKTEQPTDVPQHHLYRFTPSPTSANDPHSVNGSMYRTQSQHSTHHTHGNTAEELCYSSSSSSTSTMGYVEHRGIDAVAVSNGDQYYHHHYTRTVPAEAPSLPAQCPCLTNPAAGNPLIGLVNQLQSTVHLLRQLPEHNTRHQCHILKRIVELDNVLQYRSHSGNTSPDVVNSSYEALPTPTESEIMSPVSSSSHSSLGHPIHEWPTMANSSGYDAYFPVSSGEQGIYHKTYHIS
ncbi:hypothetical protein CERSUDRAFT_92724 [Gelatoporia subvermispora B]|uniref:Uncharacterized protein n=1 Tax=Ceriporiopsis subvermispora (strain B) TaxID=914234 RepID=M2PU17_CERS8|nr:hypothetical protein CERSUDRAFT_92724 [Gelatoporia subvermispora B]